MNLFPLPLGIRPKADAKGGSSSSQPKSIAEKAHKRDDYTCRFCAFRSVKYQRVIACEAAGKDLPFATICTLCEQCMVLERTGVSGAGYLIWLPEIGQSELNHIVRSIYIARGQTNKIANDPGKPANTAALAGRALDALNARRAESKKRLGTDDPLALATVLHEAVSAKDRHEVVAKLDGVRFLSGERYLVRGAENYMPHMIEYWTSNEGPYAKLPVNGWAELFDRALSAVGHA